MDHVIDIEKLGEFNLLKREVQEFGCVTKLVSIVKTRDRTFSTNSERSK